MKITFAHFHFYTFDNRMVNHCNTNGSVGIKKTSNIAWNQRILRDSLPISVIFFKLSKWQTGKMILFFHSDWPASLFSQLTPHLHRMYHSQEQNANFHWTCVFLCVRTFVCQLLVLASGWFNVCIFVMDECVWWINDIEMNGLFNANICTESGSLSFITYILCDKWLQFYQFFLFLVCEFFKKKATQKPVQVLCAKIHRICTEGNECTMHWFN